MMDNLTNALAGIAATPLKITMETNRHSSCYGYAWGWFERDGQSVAVWNEHEIKLEKPLPPLIASALVDLYKNKYPNRNPRIVPVATQGEEK